MRHRGVDGVAAQSVVEALACMVEQPAYVWYAQDALQESAMPLDEAAEIVTRIWCRGVFGERE